MLGIALPADHPVWTAAEEPLPRRGGRRPRRRRARPAGSSAGRTTTASCASSTTAPTTRSRARSSATRRCTPGSGTRRRPAPLLDDEAWDEPLDQSVALVDADGRATHRSGMTLLRVRRSTTASASRPRRGASRTASRSTRTVQTHGSGLVGTSVVVGTLTVVSVVRGPWEVRAVARRRRRRRASRSAARGWPVSGEPAFLAHGVRGDGLDLAARGRRARHRGPAGQGRQPARHLDRDPLGLHPGGRRQLVGHRRLPRAAPDTTPRPLPSPTQQLTVTWPDARVTTCTSARTSSSTAGDGARRDDRPKRRAP